MTLGSIPSTTEALPIKDRRVAVSESLLPPVEGDRAFYELYVSAEPCPEASHCVDVELSLSVQRLLWLKRGEPRGYVGLREIEIEVRPINASCVSCSAGESYPQIVVGGFAQSEASVAVNVGLPESIAPLSLELSKEGDKQYGGAFSAVRRDRTRITRSKKLLRFQAFPEIGPANTEFLLNEIFNLNFRLNCDDAAQMVVLVKPNIVRSADESGAIQKLSHRLDLQATSINQLPAAFPLRYETNLVRL